MKTVRTVGLTIVLLIPFRLAGAQVLNTDVGIPIGPGDPNPNSGSTIVLDDFAYEGLATPVGEPGDWPYTTTFAGDLILYNQAGGVTPSNWYADIRFFNPLDPTGSLDMPATELEAIFPSDLGPGGFSTFQLFPDYNLVPATNEITAVLGTEGLFGPVGGIIPGQLAIINFLAITESSAPAGTPEPGSLALVAGLAVTSVLATRRLRRRN